MMTVAANDRPRHGQISTCLAMPHAPNARVVVATKATYATKVASSSAPTEWDRRRTQQATVSDADGHAECALPASQLLVKPSPLAYDDHVLTIQVISCYPLRLRQVGAEPPLPPSPNKCFGGSSDRSSGKYPCRGIRKSGDVQATLGMVGGDELALGGSRR